VLIHSVLKALDIIDCLSVEKEPLSAREVARRCDLSRPTAYRLLISLANKNFVVSPREGHFTLSPKFLSISKNLLDRYDLIEIAKPYMDQLSQFSGETVHLTILDGVEMLYIGKVDSSQSIRMHSSTGTRNPVYSTATGKAVLASLPLSELQQVIRQIQFTSRTAKTITTQEELIEALEIIRHQKYAIDDLENEEGIRCVAAPVFDHSGTVIGGLSISGPAYRLEMDRLVELSKHVITAADTISHLSGYIPNKREEKK
jgi:DNA-binding IclR family transcriptional regulator